MKLSSILFNFFSLMSVSAFETCGERIVNENCVSFSVGSGTGCSWMCNYCQNQLKTPNYYFTDGVCHYETGGCVGNPQVGVVYTCCVN